MRGETRVGKPEGERRVGAVEGRHAAVPVASRGAQDPGARAAHDGFPAQPAGGRVERADGGDRLVLGAVGRAGGDVPGEQRAVAKLGDVARESSRQRAAAGLHVADPDAPAGLGGRPCSGRQVAVQWKHQDGRQAALRCGTVCAERQLQRRDRVLKGRVVELHHVVGNGASSASVKATGQVYVNDVESTRAEVEVERLDVDDHLVALPHVADQRRCRPKPGASRRRSRPSAGRYRRPHRAAGSASRCRIVIPMPRRRRASRTIRSAATLSSAVWLASVPFANRTHSKPRRAERVCIAATPRRDLARLDATALERRPRGNHGRGARGESVSAEHLGHLNVQVALVLARGPRAGVGHSPDRLAGALVVEASGLALDPAVAGTTFEADPPSIVPTFAVVSWSSRPSFIAAIAAAAAAIALRPASGRIPEWASTPSKSAVIRL